MPHGYYHVYTRGNDRQDIYFGNWSGRLFLRELERVVIRFGWWILAYCLMPNHYHVVMQIGDAGLSDGMSEPTAASRRRRTGATSEPITSSASASRAR